MHQPISLFITKSVKLTNPRVSADRPLETNFGEIDETEFLIWRQNWLKLVPEKHWYQTT